MKSRKNIFCTIFDSNYIDKGIVLYESLEKVCSEFTLFVFAFDEMTYQILTEQNFVNMQIIPLDDYETEEQRSVKNSRDRGEYCWTFTPVIIEYVLDNYDVDMCTYIDADMFFYNSPEIILKEMDDDRISVGVMGHRFANKGVEKKMIENSGRFCVEFNSFKNNLNARRLLNIWKNQCLQECSYENCGDQRYITDWCDKYSFVHEFKCLGGGVAPWNIGDYKFYEEDGKKKVKCKGNSYDFIFYHFQGMQYSEDGRVKLCAFTSNMGMAGKVSKKDIYNIYIPYLSKTEKCKQMIRERYGVDRFEFGCKRKFDIVPFHLGKFLKAIIRRIRHESFGSAVNFISCVMRKKLDVIQLYKVL